MLNIALSHLFNDLFVYARTADILDSQVHTEYAPVHAYTNKPLNSWCNNP